MTDKESLEMGHPMHKCKARAAYHEKNGLQESPEDAMTDDTITLPPHRHSEHGVKMWAAPDRSMCRNRNCGQWVDNCDYPDCCLPKDSQ